MNEAEPAVRFFNTGSWNRSKEVLSNNTLIYSSCVTRTSVVERESEIILF